MWQVMVAFMSTKLDLWWTMGQPEFLAFLSHSKDLTPSLNVLYDAVQSFLHLFPPVAPSLQSLFYLKKMLLTSSLWPLEIQRCSLEERISFKKHA